MKALKRIGLGGKAKPKNNAAKRQSVRDVISRTVKNKYLMFTSSLLSFISSHTPINLCWGVVVGGRCWLMFCLFVVLFLNIKKIVWLSMTSSSKTRTCRCPTWSRLRLRGRRTTNRYHHHGVHSLIQPRKQQLDHNVLNNLSLVHVLVCVLPVCYRAEEDRKKEARSEHRLPEARRNQRSALHPRESEATQRKGESLYSSTFSPSPSFDTLQHQISRSLIFFFIPLT